MVKTKSIQKSKTYKYCEKRKSNTPNKTKECIKLCHSVSSKGYVYTDSSWKGDFLYFNNVEAERAVENGFQLAADSSAAVGPFVEMVNCFACTCEQSGVRVFDNFNGVLNISNINARDNNDHGILLECKPANQVSISDPIIGGNNRNSSGSTNGITIINEVHNVSIIGGKCGGDTKDLAGQGNQAYGIACEGDNHKNMRFIGIFCVRFSYI